MGTYSESTGTNMYAFYKYSPADHNKRSPADGFAIISRLYYYTSTGITEGHTDSDKWLGMRQYADQ